MPEFLKKYIPVADAITQLFKPNVEVVIHDYERDEVFYIANPVSGRKHGSASYLDGELKQIPVTESVIGPYEKAGKNGQRVQAISAVLREEDKIVGLMCINLDYSKYEPALELLESLLRPKTLSQAPEILFKNDWLEQVRFEMREFADSCRTSLIKLSANQRKELIAHLDSKRFLYAKNSVEQIASILNISRATAYNDLKEVRRKG